MKRKKGPQFVRYFGPLLDALRKLGGSGTPGEVIECIAQDLGISDEAQNELLQSGQPRFSNQVHWARFYLAREGLLDASKRGVWSLNERGRTTTLSSAQAHEVYLKWSHIDQEQRRTRTQELAPEAEQIPESLDNGSGDYRTKIIELMLKLPATGFERLSQRILREAGFVQVVVTGKTGDGGIDGNGTLQINPLVSFKVLFQ